MKKLIVILTLGFLVAFSGTSQASGHGGHGYGYGRGYGYARGGYGYGYGRGYGYGYRGGWGPRVAIGGPCYRPVWFAPRWVWDWRVGRYTWARGYWR